MVETRNASPSRGGIYRVSLNPTLGHEQQEYRPVLVISPDAYNAKTGLAIVCPITSQVKGYPFEVAFSSGKISGAVLTDQPRTLDWRARKFAHVCKLDMAVYEEVRAKILALLEK